MSVSTLKFGYFLVREVETPAAFDPSWTQTPQDITASIRWENRCEVVGPKMGSGFAFDASEVVVQT